MSEVESDLWVVAIPGGILVWRRVSTVTAKSTFTRDIPPWFYVFCSKAMRKKHDRCELKIGVCVTNKWQGLSKQIPYEMRNRPGPLAEALLAPDPKGRILLWLIRASRPDRDDELPMGIRPLPKTWKLPGYRSELQRSRTAVLSFWLTTSFRHPERGGGRTAHSDKTYKWKMWSRDKNFSSDS